MPSEKSDLCRESDCVFEPLLQSLAVRGVSGGGKGRGGGRGWRSVLTGGVDRWEITQDEPHKALPPQSKL